MFLRLGIIFVYRWVYQVMLGAVMPGMVLCGAVLLCIVRQGWARRGLVLLCAVM